MEKRILKEKHIGVLILFFLFECGLYCFIEQQIKSKVNNEIGFYRANIEKSINELMGYKEKITTGEFIGSPEEVSLDLEWFRKDNWFKYSDSTRRQASVKNFIFYFNEGDTYFTKNENHPYNEIKKIEDLYIIIYPHAVWEIKHLYRDGYIFYLRYIVPYAWGYKKCDAFNKQYRPTNYTICKNAFEYLTKESIDYSQSFTGETYKINAILGLENRYFNIKRVEKENLEDKQNFQRRINNEREYYTSNSHFICINNYYATVFCEKQSVTEYQLNRKTDLIEKEIFNETLNVFVITTICILLVSIGGYYAFTRQRKK